MGPFLEPFLGVNDKIENFALVQPGNSQYVLIVICIFYSIFYLGHFFASLGPVLVQGPSFVLNEKIDNFAILNKPLVQPGTIQN